MLRAGASLCLGLLLAGCPKPGEGDRAALGFQVCQPVIDALARYEAEAGGYPASLDPLAPAYLPTVPRAVNDHPIEYQRTAASYRLRFSYEGPGMNRCDFSPETKWVCSGYY